MAQFYIWNQMNILWAPFGNTIPCNELHHIEESESAVGKDLLSQFFPCNTEH